MDNIVTSDLSKYRYQEIDEMIGLLTAIRKNGLPDFLGEGLTIKFNTNSGIVFLSDEDFNVGVLENDKIVQFYLCSNCGNEGTQKDGKAEGWDFEKYNGYCSKNCEKA